MDTNTETDEQAYTRHRDERARELYDARYRHDAPGCGQLLTLAELLSARQRFGPCPKCGQYSVMGLSPDITAARASAMLSGLRQRRLELGLKNNG